MSEEIEVILPKLGESIMNATVVQWFKKEGERIHKDEPLLEVSTDKVNSEIPSPASGVLKKILAQPDQELDVGGTLAIIETSLRTDTSSLERVVIEEQQSFSASLEEEKREDYYSPALLRLARENNVSLRELEAIQGTGLQGRITKKDLEQYLATLRKPCPVKSKVAPAFLEAEIEQIKMTGMRKAIADNMVRSFYEAPHASLISEVDVTGLVKLIAEEKEAFLKKHGAKLTVTSFVVRAIARALGSYPLLNSSLSNDTILVKRFVNLGLAVSVEQGILVPVIKHCQKLSLPDIARAIGELSQKAREGSLVPNEVKEGTITVTNFGMSGVQIGIPIIRYPEVAIVGMGAITKKVVVFEDELFGIRSILYVSLTFDHRVIDGMYGCGFLACLKKHLEEDLIL